MHADTLASALHLRIPALLQEVAASYDDSKLPEVVPITSAEIRLAMKQLRASRRRATPTPIHPPRALPRIAE